MKLKRLLSCVLTLAMTLTITALPAVAVTFPDVTSHWARTYIEDMTYKGMFKGYEDGTFKPEGELTAAEALALCARVIGLDDSTAATMMENRKADVNGVLKGNQSWFYREFAMCLETGILSYDELRSMVNSGAMTQPVTKEQLSRYLVRAMQLGPMAQRLGSYSLSFSDTISIDSAMQPYVYLLNMYGIVQGEGDNKFSPKTPVTRAVMSTMLSRAISFMGERGIVPDVPAYTRYAFQQGTIAAVTTGDRGVIVLTLNNDLTHTPFSVSLPSGVTVYESNMKANTGALRTGRHARICFSGQTVANTVRLSAGLDSFSGTVNDITGNEITMTVDGSTRVLTMDRFTQVQVGTKTVGDRTLVDVNAGYTAATFQTNDQGLLTAIQFNGGTRSEMGIVSSAVKVAGAAGNVTLRVIGFDGVTRQYTVPSGAAITVNGVAGTLTGNYSGCYVNLQVSNEDATVLSAAVDTVTKYVQGAVKGSSWQSNPNTITIADIGTSKSVSYHIDSGVNVTYNGDTVQLRDVKKDWFVTGRLSGGNLISVDCYPGSVVTEGILTGRVFGLGSNTAATLEITRKDDTVVNFNIDLADPPTIKRDGYTSSIDKLRVGDSVVVTVRYSVVTSVEAVPQIANMTGTINRIIQEKGGNTLEVTLADGSQVSYLVTSGISVTQNGKDVGASALKPDFRIAMVVNGEQISAIEIMQAVDNTSQLTGTIIYVNNSDKTIMLRAVDAGGNEELVTVHVSTGTRIMTWDGADLYLRELVVGDLIQANGAHSGADFNATLIMKK